MPCPHGKPPLGNLDCDRLKLSVICSISRWACCRIEWRVAVAENRINVAICWRIEWMPGLQAWMRESGVTVVIMWWLTGVCLQVDLCFLLMNRINVTIVAVELKACGTGTVVHGDLETFAHLWPRCSPDVALIGPWISDSSLVCSCSWHTTHVAPQHTHFQPQPVPRSLVQSSQAIPILRLMLKDSGRWIAEPLALPSHTCFAHDRSRAPVAGLLDARGPVGSR